MPLDQPVDCFVAGRREEGPLVAQVICDFDAGILERPLETGLAQHGHVEEGWPGDMGDALVALGDEVLAHTIGAGEAVLLDTVHCSARQVADEDSGYLDLGQLMLDAMQRCIRDNQAVDALGLDLLEIGVSVILGMSAGHIGIIDQRVDPVVDKRCLHRANHFGIVGRADIWDHDGNDVGASSTQRLRLAIGHIAEFVYRFLDLGTKRRRDPVAMIDDVRHRGKGHACKFRDFLYFDHRQAIASAKRFAKPFAKRFAS